MTSNTPETMRAVQISDYGDIKTSITVASNIPIPKVPLKSKNNAIVKTLAVSLAPGDIRVLSGKTKEYQGPPSFPYIPGGDLCGVIISSSDPTFRPGQTVAARFHEKPLGALGEYALIHTDVCDIVPDETAHASVLSNESVAALGSSATAALCVAEHIREGDRVLIYGAGGGVGSYLCQMARRLRGASFVVGMSRDAERLERHPLCCDVGLDYRNAANNPFLREDFCEEPFDVVVDLAGGVWPLILKAAKGRRHFGVKPARQGGRFLTMTPDNPIFEIHNVLHFLRIFFFPIYYRYFYTRTFSRHRFPTYNFVWGLPDKREIMTKVLNAAAEGKIISCIDPEGPFPLTTEGVKKAFYLQESRHVKGKVVIKIADKDKCQN